MERGNAAKVWLARWKRSDLPLLRFAWSRLKDERAAIFLEFALAFPVVLMFTLFLIEMCLYWDSTAMANHTAFTLARIAKVHYSGTGFDIPRFALSPEEDSGETSVASFLMMTVTRGWLNSGEQDDYWQTRQDELREKVPSDRLQLANQISRHLGSFQNLSFDSEKQEMDWTKLVSGAPDPVEMLIREGAEWVYGLVWDQVKQHVTGVLKDAVLSAINSQIPQLSNNDFWEQLGIRYEMARLRVIKNEAVQVNYRPLRAEEGDSGTDAGEPVSLANPNPDGLPKGSQAPAAIVEVFVNYPMPMRWFSLAPLVGRDDDVAKLPNGISARGRWAMLIEPVIKGPALPKTGPDEEPEDAEAAQEKAEEQAKADGEGKPDWEDQLNKDVDAWKDAIVLRKATEDELKAKVDDWGTISEIDAEMARIREEIGRLGKDDDPEPLQEELDMWRDRKGQIEGLETTLRGRKRTEKDAYERLKAWNEPGGKSYTLPKGMFEGMEGLVDEGELANVRNEMTKEIQADVNKRITEVLGDPRVSEDDYLSFGEWLAEQYSVSR